MVREKTVKKVSIIDLGSNSVRMNIVQIQPNGAASLILQEKEMVQLGRDAFLQKKLQESAMQRTLSVLRNFVALCKNILRTSFWPLRRRRCGTRRTAKPF